MKKVAIYNCAHNEELNSIQIEKVSEYLQSTPDWQIDLQQDIYSDVGYSKMQTQGRPALEMLINKVKDGKYDLIVIEQASNFLRDTRALVRFVEEMSRNGVDIYWMDRGILDMRLLAIMQIEYLI